MTAPKQWINIMAQIKDAGSYQPEAVEHVIDTLLSQSELSNWVIGDIINMTNASNSHIERLAKMAGVQVKTLESYARTAIVWKSDLRWQLLEDNEWIKYSHMKCLVPIINDSKFGLRVAIDAIKEASSNLMTIRELQRHIAVNIRKNKPKPKRVQVAECEGFFWIDDEGYGNIHLAEKVGDMQQEEIYSIQVYATGRNL